MSRVPEGEKVKIRHNGQLFSHIGDRQHTCRDGSEASLIVWSAACADCGAAYEFAMPDGAEFKPTRRCEQHRQAGRRVKPSAPAEHNA